MNELTKEQLEKLSPEALAAWKAYDSAALAVEEAWEEYDAKNGNFSGNFVEAWERRSAALRPVYADLAEKRRGWIQSMPDEVIEKKPKDSVGDWFSVEDFTECVKGLMFVNDDGFGQFTMGGLQTDVPAIPSDIAAGLDTSRFDGVMWYNK